MRHIFVYECISTTQAMQHIVELVQRSRSPGLIATRAVAVNVPLLHLRKILSRATRDNFTKKRTLALNIARIDCSIFLQSLRIVGQRKKQKKGKEGGCSICQIGFTYSDLASEALPKTS